MNRRTYVAAVGSTLPLALAGCLDGEPSGDYDVGMTIDSFRPQEVTVDAGTTVEFRNTSSHTHTVTAYQDSYPDEAEYWASGDFDSQTTAEEAWNSSREGKIEPDDAYEHTFEIPGQYGYFCIPHEDANMVGTVFVEE